MNGPVPHRPVAGNVYDKYNSANPVVIRLMRGFLNSMDDLLMRLDVGSVIEVGCGEGELAARILRMVPGVRYAGFDISPEVIGEARRRYPGLSFSVLPIEQLTAEAGEADLVIASEVMEHLDDPAAGIESILRLPFRYLLLSVPREPVWRFLNIARGRYLMSFGNTPGHVNHWSKRGFLGFLSRFHDSLKVEFIRSPFPWTMVVCSKKQGPVL